MAPAIVTSAVPAGTHFFICSLTRQFLPGYFQSRLAALSGSPITVRFQDQTGLNLEITPGFSLKPRYFTLKTGDYRVLKSWPEIKCEG
jgi:hypothetical protein